MVSSLLYYFVTVTLKHTMKPPTQRMAEQLEILASHLFAED